MEEQYYKSTGISLILGALLIILTMSLHPSGGSLQKIIATTKIITGTHTLAICCIPFVLFGFYGLSKRLANRYHISILAFIIVSLGLIAALFAALFNGLALPYFLNMYSDRLSENLAILKPITSFSFAVNKSLDYIFICALALAIFLYSLQILQLKTSKKWIGLLGIIILIITLLGLFNNFVFTSLLGFRIFTFSISIWIFATGFLLIKSK